MLKTQTLCYHSKLNMSSIGEILKKYNKKVDALDLELIVSHVIKKPREFVLAYLEYKMPKFNIENLKLKISRRMRGEPLAYILGEKEFYGLKFKVNKSALIPRPETELMVEEAVNHVTRSPRFRLGEAGNTERITNNKKILIIDVGTGSGCVIITLAKLLELRIMNYELLFFGTDINNKAIKVAKQNAKLHKVDRQIKFLKGNLLEPVVKKIKNKELKIENCKLIIAANLPYLTPAQIKSSPSIQYEPKLALNAGRDGLKYYRQLFKQLRKIKKMLCAMCYVLCEIDPSQTSKIKKIIKNQFPEAGIYPIKSSRKIAGGISRNAKSFNRVKIKKDLRGLDRIIVTKI